MFIATSDTPKHLAPLGAKPAAEQLKMQAKAIALLRSLGIRKDRQAINISPLWGEATNNLLLHFQFEFAVCDGASCHLVGRFRFRRITAIAALPLSWEVPVPTQTNSLRYDSVVVTQRNYDGYGPMRSVPPRGSGWVLEWGRDRLSINATDPPATAWWY